MLKNIYRVNKEAISLLNMGNDVVMEEQIFDALQKEEFILYYQPQVDIITGYITGIEALIRWNHPQLGLIYPKDFIPFTEKTGQIKVLGEYILLKACEHIKQMQKLGYKELKVGVNISAVQFQDQSLVDKITTILEKTGLDPRYLELEITEYLAIKPTENILKQMNDLKELGICFSIDDFGTGYSTLGYLKDFPFDTIKIDRSFIQSMESNSVSSVIIESIVYLGKKLNLRIVAEGVELEEQLELLKKLEVNEIQGFLFSKPVPYIELSNVLKKYNRCD